jgi:hypothetical protein
MIHHLGLGVWAFLASPAAGLVASARGRGPLRFATGLADGVRGLLAHVVFAVSNASAKWSGAMRKARAWLLARSARPVETKQRQVRVVWRLAKSLSLVHLSKVSGARQAACL